MGLEKYVSKQVKINRPDWIIYNLLSDFNHFTPMLEGRVDNWRVEGDTCSFTVKGFTIHLRMLERTPYSTVKVGGDEGSPFEFTFWIQLVKMGENDTRMRLTLHANLNVMMKMMLGKKLEQALDRIAEQIATAFNMPPEEARRMAEAQGWRMPEGMPDVDLSDMEIPSSIEEVEDAEVWPMPDPNKPVS
jgi:carbon monoxide dehydrogenase subunit G